MYGIKNKNKKSKKEIAQEMEIRKYRRGELAKEILLIIAAGVIIPASLAIPNLPVALNPLLKFLSKRTKAKEQSFIKSVIFLKRERLVSIKEKNGEQIMVLSEDGKKKVLKFRVNEMTIKKPPFWDGDWRIVIFDIPERKRLGRDILRAALMRLGFYQLQKSCFIYPYHCKDEIDFITEIYGISRYTNYILARDIEGKDKLKKFFDL
jgi:DNA-binding transcriptional regulator PaaX